MCGIAGILSSKSRKFNYSTFCYLGMLNDSRGGDSCGIFIDGKVEYGTGANKLFSNFFITSRLLKDTKHASIALVHCRKASIGAVNEYTAQPVVIKNKSGKVEYVLMHNGTIYNYRNLAQKYLPGMSIEGLTDSQVMAMIFYNCGYDVLNEYIGSGVFVIVDYRSKEVLMFKGASLYTQYAQTFCEERPLFYCIYKEQFYFSSIMSSLAALGANVYSLPANSLIKIPEMKVIATYSRDTCYQEWYNSYYSTARYVDYCDYDNTYFLNGKIIHGMYYLSDFGKVMDFGSNQVYFFNGIPMKNNNAFSYINKIYLDSKLPISDFVEKFKNVIRYLSISEVYKSGDLWYHADSPGDCSLYTGPIKSLCSTMVLNVENGLEKVVKYEYNKPDFHKTYNINFKQVKLQCKSMMKLLEN